MDQQEPRENFVNNLYSFCEEVELTDSFIELLKHHSNAVYLNEVMVSTDKFLIDLN
jgi:hypothetical protein